MNFDDLKQLLNNNGERLVFIENGKPSFVLVSFEDYQGLVHQQQAVKSSSFLMNAEAAPQAEPKTSIHLPPQLNTEAASMLEKKLEPAKTSPSPVEPFVAKELKLEDLPF